MARNRKKRKSKKSSISSKKKIAIALLCIVSSVLIVYGVNYFELIQKSTNESKIAQEKSTKELMDKMKKMLEDEKKRLKNSEKKSIESKRVAPLPPVRKSEKSDSRYEFSEIKDYKESLKTTDTQKHTKNRVKQEIYHGKPKLAIIIDDVSFAYQVKLLKKIPYKINPSFFPPSSRHPNTIKLSKEFDFALLHLPTEALRYKRAEEVTLLTSDSYETLQNKIKLLKSKFPNIVYYNNHTGSKFTADYNSMKSLLKIMKEEGLVFIDSRTTAKTKAPKISKDMGFRLISRDIFIDNNPQKNLIKEQLKKAVNIAKKRGYAVAIGHPHKNTLEVLINAKELFREVQLVYVKEL